MGMIVPRRGAVSREATRVAAKRYWLWLLFRGGEGRGKSRKLAVGSFRARIGVV